MSQMCQRMSSRCSRHTCRTHLQDRPWLMPARACTADQICCGISLGMSSNGRNADRSVLKMYSCADNRNTLNRGLRPLVASWLCDCKVCQSHKRAMASMYTQAVMPFTCCFEGRRAADSVVILTRCCLPFRNCSRHERQQLHSVSTSNSGHHLHMDEYCLVQRTFLKEQPDRQAWCNGGK